MKGLKLKPIYLAHNSLCVAPPAFLPVSAAVLSENHHVADLDKVRELIRGRTIKKSRGGFKENEAELVQNLSEFKSSNQLNSLGLSPLMRRSTFRRFVTLRKGQPVVVSAALPTASRVAKLGDLLRQSKALTFEARAARNKDTDMNRRYEAYQKEKSKQFEVELAAIKTLKAQIKDEVAAARLRLEELTAVYTAEVNELYMEEAKAVQAIQQSNAGPTHLIERERIRKVIQHAHQEHFKAREAIVTTMHPTFGELKMQNVAPKLSKTPGNIRRPGPELGEHNKEIYGDVLAMTAEQMAELEGKGII